MKKFIYLCFSITMIVSTLNSQTFMFGGRPADNFQFSLKYQHPFIDFPSIYGSSIPEISYNHNIYSLHINAPISKKLNLITDFNLSNISVEVSGNGYYRTTSQSESAFGNIYVALQIANSRVDSSKVNIEFGVFLPTASEDNFSALISSYQYDMYYLPKYIPNALSFNFIISKWNTVSENFGWGFESGPVILIPTKGEGSNTELFLKYGIGTNICIQDFFFITEFNGIMVVSESYDSFTDRFINTLGLGAGYRFGKYIPKVFYKFEIKDELRAYNSGLLGLSFEVEL